MISEAVKLEREKRKTAREAKLWELAGDPTLRRLAMLSAIIAYSTYCARSEQNVGPVASALAFALPGIGIPLIAADAGIKDKWALAAISAAGVGYTTGQMVQGWNQTGVNWPQEVLAAITPWKD